MAKLSSVTFNEFMGSLDVDSLFINIPLKETINICTNLLYNKVDVIEGINKTEFEKLLFLTTQESYFMFNIFYKQKAGVAWDRPWDLLWQMFSYRFVKLNSLNSVLTNSNQFFTEDMLIIFLFY